MAKSESKTIGDKVFWGFFASIAFAGLAYLMIFALINEQFLTAILAFIFISLWSGSLVLGKFIGAKEFNLLEYGTLTGNVSWFFIGFLVYLGINIFSLNITDSLSIFSVSTNSLYATVSAEIPQNINFIMTVFIIPIVEELFWIFGIPTVLFALMNNIKPQYKIFGNPFVQIAVISIIAGWSFAIFHVGKVSLIAFVISAILFRTIMIVSVYSDWAFNIFPFVQVTPALALGAHIGNNLASFGVSSAWNLILLNFATTGFIIIGVFGIMILILVNAGGKKLYELST